MSDAVRRRSSRRLTSVASASTTTGSANAALPNSNGGDDYDNSTTERPSKRPKIERAQRDSAGGDQVVDAAAPQAQRNVKKKEAQAIDQTVNEDSGHEQDEKVMKGKRKSRKKTKVTAVKDEAPETEAQDGETTKKKRKPRTKKEVVEPRAEDYPDRITSLWKIGAHISAAGGVENAIVNAATIRANAFALFLKSQRKWTGPALTPESISKFKSRLEEFGYSPQHILPHGSYLVNLGNPDDEKRIQAYTAFLDELRRCEELGLILYNFHPGSTVGQVPPETSISLIANCLNRAHRETTSIVTVIENMAGAGNVIGGPFSQLGAIIKEVHDKSRVGICLDTCHMFAAGYDIRTKEGWNAMLSEFDKEVGLKYLRGMHINDSKATLGSKKDRHQNIGQGELGLATFWHVVTDTRVQDIPLIMETPNYDDNEVWKKEIEVIHRLSGLRLTDDPHSVAPTDTETVVTDDAIPRLLENWSEEIKVAVEIASKSSTSKTKKKSAQKTRTGGAAEDEGDKEIADEEACPN